MGLMTKAMGMANAGNDKARQADTANALVPAKKKARAKLGKLYSWGSGDYGRLGHGDNLNQKLPKAVDVLRDKDVRKFACGARHCIALGSDGTVYSWGYGGDGQLGHGDFQIQTMPTVVKALQGEGVIDVSCGEKHSLALTSGGDVYSWGDGSLGQLGLGDSRKQHTPSRIMELAGKMILQCSAGHFHSACVEDTGAVYSWGAGQSGRLGIGDEANVMTPTLVEELQDAGIQTVRCFAEHTMAINVATEAAEVGKFDEHSQARLVQRVKELEVKLRREVLKSEEAASLLQQGKSTLIESQQNVQRLQAQNDALLQERVELYMKMQSLENQLATATSDKENLDKELMALVSMPTKLAEITSQGVRQIATGEPPPGSNPSPNPSDALPQPQPQPQRRPTLTPTPPPPPTPTPPPAPTLASPRILPRPPTRPRQEPRAGSLRHGRRLRVGQRQLGPARARAQEELPLSAAGVGHDAQGRAPDRRRRLPLGSAHVQRHGLHVGQLELRPARARQQEDAALAQAHRGP